MADLDALLASPDEPGPNQVEAHIARALTIMTDPESAPNRSVKNAIDDLSEAIKLVSDGKSLHSPSKRESQLRIAYQWRAMAYVASGDKKSGLRDYNQFLKLHPEADDVVRVRKFFKSFDVVP